jgi:hypothetical protein
LNFTAFWVNALLFVPTSTATVEGSLGGDLHMSAVGVASIASTTVLPNRHVAFEAEKLIPDTVTKVPPDTGPDDGDTDKTMESSRMPMNNSLLA